MSWTAWTALGVAGLLEVAWAFCMKASDGFRKPALTAATVVLMLLSFGLLAYAMRTLPLGTSYAVWTGIGALGAAIVGMVLLGEARTAWRVACIALIVVGILGLKLTDGPRLAA